MAKEKTTITVDRAKLAEARALRGVKSASAAIDVALSQLVRGARCRGDVEAYTEVRATQEEAGLSETYPDWARPGRRRGLGRRVAGRAMDHPAPRRERSGWRSSTSTGRSSCSPAIRWAGCCTR